MRSLPRTQLFSYCVAIGGVLLALVLTTNIELLAGRTPLFFAAVVASAWFGGRGPGLLALSLAAVVAGFFVLPPENSFDLDAGAAFQLATFLAVAAPISWLIAALKQREASLEESEARYRFLFENNPFPMWIFDRDTLAFLAINDAATHYYGYTRSEFLSMTIIDIRPAGDVPALLRETTPDADDFKRVGVWKHIRKDGRSIDVDITSHEILFEGRPARFVLAMDVTEREAAEAAVREKEAQLQTIVENLTEGLAVSNPGGKLLHFNRTALELHGFTDLAECQMHLNKFGDIFTLAEIDGTRVPLADWPLARVLRGEILRDVELRVARRDQGWEKIFNYGGVLIRDDDGGPIMAVVTISDITERKRSDERFRQIIEHAPDGNILVNQRGEIQLVNAQIEKLFGYGRDELLGKSVETLVPERFRGQHAGYRGGFTDAPAPRSMGSGRDLYGLRKDGTEFPVEIGLNPLKTEKGMMVLGTVADITKRKRAEDDLRALNETLEHRVVERTAELEAVNKELEAFSYSVSHDLRAPLRHINGFSMALLEDYAGVLDETGKIYLNEVRDASQEMAQLIDDVLQLARVTRSGMHREDIDLSEIAREIIADLNKRHPDRTVKIDIGDGPTAYGDRRLLDIVLTNLLENAWKFTSKRKSAEITFGHGTFGGVPAYFVRDNGAGFDMAYAGKLYGAFQRLHGATEFEGTGIGLATVQRIINRHGGQVWAEGKVDEGAVFYFSLPHTTEGE